MSTEIPFCPCTACAVIQEREPCHVIREARRIVILEADAEYDIAGMALCKEHHQAHLRIQGWREAPPVEEVCHARAH